MVPLRLCEISKSYGSGEKRRTIISELNLNVEPGEIVAIRGDNGTGKTTVLKLIVRIEEPTSGMVRYGPTDDSEPVRLGFVQQNYAASLLPWLSALDNVAIPLRLRGERLSVSRTKAAALLEELGFRNLPLSARPHQLSGGQQQRVAVARALIVEPHVLVLDEPFASLDAHTSRDLQETLSTMHQHRRMTILFVSHDLDHCVYLADRIILFHGSPARVASDFHISLPRPRTRSMMLEEPYQKARLSIIAAEERIYARR